ncbi:diaminopimelate epimerase [Arthrobacter zhangbolii]|uniref:Diaminopimelate epimerase n=1 Tax=Arthrobacter zhangbolii TaxID=2886936 RepID=A0A9X1M948_9MICC|nr:MULTISPECIES: diaminopimelate epimerase [Arthrobacter]MCC3273152.1 diaminopimelate epimerase [Arthrobacter zhangbolii]MCC3295492.1 diaminopimelate epimerase [Arthrobacter zhangbolii]MDN3905078.1 diaminopimelate epimerase [Arthrobacter sp. YD2]UON93615.1 diaminopimelate epimerase [Arthrobacter zhangbolii]
MSASGLPASLAGLPFAKGHGTGNDFVLIADVDGSRNLTADEVAAVCDRHRGVGADGFIRAVRSEFVAEGRALLETAPEAEWFMDYRNSDGSVSEMCGNGVRVFVHFLLEEHLLELGEGESLAIGTRAGLKTVSRISGGYAVDMGPWEFIYPDHAAAKAMDAVVNAGGLEVPRPGLSVNMGNPHTVVALAELSELAGTNLTAPPSVQPEPEHGTNVEFVVPAEPLVEDGVGLVTMRVHERGVGETLSCGTGACAAAVAVRFWAGAQAPDSWAVTVPGGVVGVRFLAGPEGREHVELSGPAVLVARGMLL